MPIQTSDISDGNIQRLDTIRKDFRLPSRPPWSDGMRRPISPERDRLLLLAQSKCVHAAKRIGMALLLILSCAILQGMRCNTCFTPNCDQGCVDLQTDNANCGSCGGVCPVGTQCSNGSCHT